MSRRDVYNAKTSLAGYFIAFTDNPTGGPNYSAFINNKAGARKQWYIQKETISGDTPTFEFITKREDVQSLAAGWAARAGHTYARYDVAFAE